VRRATTRNPVARLVARLADRPAETRPIAASIASWKTARKVRHDGNFLMVYITHNSFIHFFTRAKYNSFIKIVFLIYITREIFLIFKLMFMSPFSCFMHLCIKNSSCFSSFIESLVIPLIFYV